MKYVGDQLAPWEPDASRLTLGDLLDFAATEYRDRVALVHGKRRITYGELRERAVVAAGALQRLGCGKGDQIAIWMTNCIEWAIAQFAIYKIGARLVSLNTQFKAAETEYILANAETSCLIMMDRFLGRFDAVSVLREICPEIDGARAGRLKSERLPHLREVICLGSSGPAFFRPFGELLAGPASYRPPAIDPTDPHRVQYTSGTTGKPKGALLTHYGLLTSYYRVAQGARLRRSADTFLISVPFSTMFGSVSSLYSALFMGSTLVLMERFDPDQVLRLIEQERITHLVGSPAMYQMILNSPELSKVNLSSVVGGMVAGAVCPVQVLQAMMDTLGMKNAVNMFGQTEGFGTASMTVPDDPMEKRLTTVGRPLPHVELQIQNVQSKQMCKADEVGEVLGRGRHKDVHTCPGYYKMPEKTAEAIDAAGWLHYGDLGSLDADGYLSVSSGRLREMYISGGYNVYPPEVESYLLAHPAIEQVAVFGVPDERLGEVGFAYVQLRPGHEVTEAQLLEWCRNTISHYKSPRYVRFGGEFPLTASGKVQRTVLRDRWTRELGAGR